MTRDGGEYRPEQGNTGTSLTPPDKRTRKLLEKGERATRKVASAPKGKLKRDERGGRKPPEVHHTPPVPGG